MRWKQIFAYILEILSIVYAQLSCKWSWPVLWSVMMFLGDNERKMSSNPTQFQCGIDKLPWITGHFYQKHRQLWKNTHTHTQPKCVRSPAGHNRAAWWIIPCFLITSPCTTSSLSSPHDSCQYLEREDKVTWRTAPSCRFSCISTFLKGMVYYRGGMPFPQCMSQISWYLVHGCNITNFLLHTREKG